MICYGDYDMRKYVKALLVLSAIAVILAVKIQGTI